MKKIYLSLALAGMLFATACSQDELSGNNGGESVVTFTAELPSALATSRADFGDGTTATTLSYAVYEANQKTPLIVGDDATTFDADLKANFEVSLVNGKSYDIIFWADAPNSIYTFDAATQSITANYAEANQEAYDGFYNVVKGMAVNGAAQQPVELYRPFAQLNIGTNDTDDAATAGLVVTETEISVVAYTTLNLFNGTVSGEKNLTYAMNAIPAGQTFPVADHDYLAMNYILVPADVATYDVTFTVFDNETKVNTRTYSTVPMERNYKTNIYGRLLTSTTEFNVEIKPAFKKEDKEYTGVEVVTVKTAADLIREINNPDNGTIEVVGDITNNGAIQIPASSEVDMILNANGNQITTGTTNDYGFIVNEGSSLTINNADVVSLGGGLGVTDGAVVTFNSGSIAVNSANTSGRYNFYVVGEGSEVTINGGEFSFSKTLNQKRAYIYAGDGATVYVTGGTFGPASTRSGYTAGILTAGTGSVIITGGTFGFDPTAWVADGYQATKNADNTWSVAAL